MPVPNSTSEYLVNTTGGAFVSQRQGGTLLGNGTTGSVITKSFLIKDATDADIKVPFPVAKSSGIYGTQKALSSGTFAYFAAGNYVILTSSTTLSGVASTEMLIPGADKAGRRAIMQFRSDFGAEIAKFFLHGRYSFTGRDRTGTKYKRRSAALFTNLANNGIQSGGPARATTYMYDIADGDAVDQAADSAANPTRAIPGELVMKVDFVTTNVSTGGDFFDYKPITGM
jgi:hypothetical protein